MQVQGKITKILDVTEGTSATSGKNWKKTSFILETTEEYNNIYCFEVFGEEKVDNLIKFNKVGDSVDVKFNVRTNEYKDRYYTSLQSWSIFKAADLNTVPPPMEEQESNSGLPF